jgi:hypothetical protein
MCFYFNKTLQLLCNQKIRKKTLGSRFIYKECEIFYFNNAKTNNWMDETPKHV